MILNSLAQSQKSSPPRTISEKFKPSMKFPSLLPLKIASVVRYAIQGEGDVALAPREKFRKILIFPQIIYRQRSEREEQRTEEEEEGEERGKGKGRHVVMLHPRRSSVPQFAEGGGGASWVGSVGLGQRGRESGEGENDATFLRSAARSRRRRIALMRDALSDRPTDRAAVQRRNPVAVMALEAPESKTPRGGVSGISREFALSLSFSVGR